MADIVVSAEAERDLDDIEQYSFERFGDLVGTDYMRSFGDVFTRLTEYPATGAVTPGVRPQVRSLIHRSHRIIYDFDGNRVIVIRILHQAMNVARALRR